MIFNDIFKLMQDIATYTSASGIIYPSKNYLKWQAIQLAIHSIVGA